MPTSGIVQPPAHALAAWSTYRADPATARARGFLPRIYPRLIAWHRYLTTRRDLTGSGLMSVVHPWESGMDNSPAWDRPLSRVVPVPTAEFTRRDLQHAAAAERPTDEDYMSILGEWGQSSPRGIYELQVPPPTSEAASSFHSNVSMK